MRLAGGFACFTVAKSALELRDERRVRASGEHLGERTPLPASAPLRKVQAGFDQGHGAQMVGLRMADGVRRHVRKNEVGGTAERVLEPSGAASSMKSIWSMVTPSIASVGKQVDPDDARPGARRRTTWLQPPGAMPRSTTALTPLSRPKRSSSSISL